MSDGVAEGVPDTVADGVAETVADGDSVALGVDDGVAEGVAEGVMLCVRLGVADGVAETVAEGVRLGVADTVADGVADAVADTVALTVAEGVADGDGVALGVADGVADTVADGVADADTNANPGTASVFAIHSCGVPELVRLKTPGSSVWAEANLNATWVIQVVPEAADSTSAICVYPVGHHVALPPASWSAPAVAIHIQSVFVPVSRLGGSGCQVDPVADVPARTSAMV